MTILEAWNKLNAATPNAHTVLVYAVVEKTRDSGPRGRYYISVHAGHQSFSDTEASLENLIESALAGFGKIPPITTPEAVAASVEMPEEQ